MENLNLLKDLAIQQNTSLPVFNLVIQVIIGLILSLILQFQYNKYGTNLSNRSRLSKLFPILTLTIILIISVVKSSIALSLGLVGALSIVRFRTPIKEPEELIYLFLCISIGIGLGANQTIATVVIILLILIFIPFLKNKYSIDKKNVFLTIENKFTTDVEQGKFLLEIKKIFSDKFEMIDFKKIDFRENEVEILILIELKEIEDFENIITKLKSKYSGINITYLDQTNIFAV